MTRSVKDEHWVLDQSDTDDDDGIQSKILKTFSTGDGEKRRRAKKHKRKDYSVIKFRLHYVHKHAISEVSSLPSLHTIRLDPISLCMTDLADPAVKAVFHRITTYFLPSLAPCCVDDSAPVTETWLERANASALLYHAMLWGYSFPDYLDRKQRKVIDRHYATAIKELIKFVDAETAASDEMLIGVALLSITEQPPTEPPSFGLFRPLLTKLQTINIAGDLRYAEPHRSAVKRFVADRGGLGKILMPGVAEAMQYWELFDSVFRLQPPEFELCASYQHFLEKKVIPLREKGLPQCPGTALAPKTAFSDLTLPEHFQDLILDMRVTCCLMVEFVSGNVAPPLKEIAMHRNLIQYRLLKLQPQDGTLAEICRLTALLFSFCVIFPWPDWNHKRMLAGMLELKMSESGLLQEIDLAGSPWEGKSKLGKRKTKLDFLMWAAMVGAMATGSELGSFVVVLARIADALEVRKWLEVKAILVKYLWLDEACNDGGQTVWRDVIERTRACDGRWYSDCDFKS